MPPKKHGGKNPGSASNKDENKDSEKSSDESSDSSTEDENDSAAKLNLSAIGDRDDADQKLEDELEDEEQKLTLVSKPLTNPALEHYIQKINSMNLFSNARFQDIQPQVSDGRKFLIDGDGLLLYALNVEGVSMESGGQMLHVLYIVERFMQTFCSRGLNFTVIFFEVWNQCWTKFPDVKLIRNCLRLHLMHNQKTVSVVNMESVWTKEFSDYLLVQRPGFIMMMTSLRKFFEGAGDGRSSETEVSPSGEWLEYICGCQLLYSDFLCLDVVDIETIHYTAVSLMATVFIHVNNFQRIRGHVDKMIHSMDKEMPKPHKTKFDFKTVDSDVRVCLMVWAASSVLNKNSHCHYEAVMKITLLTLAAVEVTGLKMRCFQNLPEQAEHVSNIVALFLKELSELTSSLPTCLSTYLDFRFVGDLWQGLFFKAIFQSVCEADGIMERKDLEEVIADRYELLISFVNQFLVGEKLSPYPVKHVCKGQCDRRPIAPKQPMKTDEFKLLPLSCKLADLFVGSDVNIQSFFAEMPKESDSGMALHETRHWHNNKALTDEFDRIPHDSIRAAKRATETNKRYAQSSRNNLAKYLTVYGSSLEGRLHPKTIVTEAPVSKGQKKTAGVSKSQGKAILSKKEVIIQANQKRIMEEKLKLIIARFQNFSKVFDRLIANGDFHGAIEKCDLELQNASESNETLLKILFLKGRAWYSLWLNECRKKQAMRNLESAKQLFLVIRKLLKMGDEGQLPLDLKQKTVISAWLHGLGFKDLANINGLPEPKQRPGENDCVGMSYIEFQLEHLGAELVRETGQKPDSRVEGFIPDPWQAKLFDIIDKRESALVVAPTSSGKTYASYYCMEKVLKESDDGVVVYVCPTKALVNQVHATIYARYRKNLAVGKALIGVFTRDYRSNVMTSQILVTVPECMELLLLSPRSQTWVRRIKYVIFDEIHCLVGQAGGLAWENSILLIQCPFLALSATIHNPEAFCAWLQKTEDFKRTVADKLDLKFLSPRPYKVSLVVHTERHNHLLKNVMKKDGSVVHVHPYSFVQLSCEGEQTGIPAHVTLSPDEVLELHRAMDKVLSPENMRQVPLSEFFTEQCPSGFISMHAVKNFHEKLRSLLNKESLEIQHKVLQILKTEEFDGHDTGDLFILKNVSVLVESLRKKGMLPALVFSYNRRMVEAIPSKLLRHLRSIDDFDEAAVTDIESESEDEKDNSEKGKRRRTRGKRFRKKVGLLRGPSMLSSKGSLRGAGHEDDKVINFVEHRLVVSKYKPMDTFPSMLRRGLGLHHGGLNAKERSAVEMLFRSKILNLITATGTLALGIHMPCKSVVVAGDSPYLNSLEFQQMSGRAGRRGFDKVGNVVFYGLNRRKMETLMTSNLPQMIGNFPLSVSLIVRVLLLVSDATFKGQSTEEAMNSALARAYTLLENALLYEIQPSLKETLKLFFNFTLQFLLRMNLISRDGDIYSSAVFITHLHYHEPGNFAFLYLLQSGALEEICKCDGKGNITDASLIELMIVLNFLFGRLPVSDHSLKVKKINSIVVLPSLPKNVEKVLMEYNTRVMGIFSSFFKCMSAQIQEKYGTETKLPCSHLCMEPDKVMSAEAMKGKLMTSVKTMHTYNSVCSTFAGLSGITDDDLFPVSGVVRHVREEVTVKFVPTLELDFRCNSYALDFFKHGIQQALVHDNGLKAGHDFTVVKDFMLVLKCLFVSLGEMLEEDAKLLKAMDQISSIFENQFSKAYIL